MEKLNKKLLVTAVMVFMLIGMRHFADAQTSTSTPAATTTPAVTASITPSAVATTSTDTTVTAYTPPPKPQHPKFSLVYKDQTFAVDQDTLNAWQEAQSVLPNNILQSKPEKLSDSLLRSLGQVPNPNSFMTTYDHRLDLVYSYIEKISQPLNQPVQEPNLEIIDGKVATFTPPQIGVSIDVYNSAINALKNLQQKQSTSSIISYQVLPQNSLASTNSLGINELIAEGTSKFNGSPKNRRFNIAVGTKKMTGIIVPQGGEFSFDDNLGPVDGEHGFLPELVIKGNNTLPEFGGGLCQVSTTAFRAAMQAGLPITARRNHAYAVQYYSPQGTDATIYPGSADLKFVNDTPGAILIWPYEKDANTLIFDFYGTKDSRQVTLEKPVVYDRTSDGAMKATWTREVKNGDQTRTDVFKSNYQPPALFHHTESFVSATGTATSGLKMPSKVQ